MLQCGYALPARERIAELQKAGTSDSGIIDKFVDEMGMVALAQPPTEGFSLLSWLMPFVAIAIGISIIAVYMRKFRKPQPVSHIPPMDLKLHNRYQERIEKEMAEFD